MSLDVPTSLLTTTELARIANFDRSTATNLDAALSEFEDRLRIYSVRDFGAVGDGVTDDTIALQAAIDAAHAFGNDAIVYLPASGDEYMFSNLKLWAYTQIRGSRMAQCQLKRIAGSTGNAITEYTAAEGNPNGNRNPWKGRPGLDPGHRRQR